MRGSTMMAALAAMALGGCQTDLAGPVTNAATVAGVERNPDAARVLAGLRQRGISVTPSDVSQVEALRDGPGYAYAVGPDYLHLHVYTDAAAAARAKARLVAGSPTMLASWVGKPQVFQCNTAIAFYLGLQPGPIAALTEMCGAPAFPR